MQRQFEQRIAAQFTTLIHENQELRFPRNRVADPGVVLGMLLARCRKSFVLRSVSYDAGLPVLVDLCLDRGDRGAERVIDDAVSRHNANIEQRPIWESEYRCSNRIDSRWSQLMFGHPALIQFFRVSLQATVDSTQDPYRERFGESRKGGVLMMREPLPIATD